MTRFDLGVRAGTKRLALRCKSQALEAARLEECERVAIVAGKRRAMDAEELANERRGDRAARKFMRQLCGNTLIRDQVQSPVPSSWPAVEASCRIWGLPVRPVSTRFKTVHL